MLPAPLGPTPHGFAHRGLVPRAPAPHSSALYGPFIF